MTPLNALLDPITIPRFLTVAQHLAAPCLDDIESRVVPQLDRVLGQRVTPGQRIGVTAGSRGITDLVRILTLVVDWLHGHGAEVVVIPAMGSHGGASAEGQVEVLRNLGITPDTVGAPILAGMEVVDLGDDPTRPCWYSADALGLDGVVVVNRVKPHTDISGPVESGVRKMMAIGLGKHAGALQAHFRGLACTGEEVERISRVLLERANVIAGVAILENSADRTRDVVIMDRAEIIDTEKQLLAESREHLPRLLVQDIDVLVVDRMGKEMSGDGIDPNVVGRSLVGVKNPRMAVNRIAVLDLTDASHGNANGIGLADVTTTRLVGKIDFTAMYTNALTAHATNGSRLPLQMPSHEMAIRCAQRMCLVPDPSRHRIVRIPDTLHLEQIQVSEALGDEVRAHPDMEIIDGPDALHFDEQGNLF